jgi:hypothetical protein
MIKSLIKWICSWRITIHTPNSFKESGLKEQSTHIGLLLAMIFFILAFRHDFVVLIDNVLTSTSLADNVVKGICCLALIIFRLYKK